MIKLLPKRMMVLASVMLAACGVHTQVNHDGTAQELHWSDIASNGSVLKKGTFPDVTHLQAMRQGMTKSQIYHLLGEPHFNEGFGVREWDYLFHFETLNQGQKEVVSCQYKILFDKNKQAQSFYWKDVSGEQNICQSIVDKKNEEETRFQLERYTLNTDALFEFDRGDLDGMTQAGREELNQVLVKIKENNWHTLRVTGYTDPVGDENYNQQLSYLRAKSVSDFLKAHGVTGTMEVRGLGEQNLVKECSNHGNKAAYYECLKPNRRVVIETEVVKMVK